MEATAKSQYWSYFTSFALENKVVRLRPVAPTNHEVYASRAYLLASPLRFPSRPQIQRFTTNLWCTSRVGPSRRINGEVTAGHLYSSSSCSPRAIRGKRTDDY